MGTFFIPLEYLVMLTIMVMLVIVFVVVMVLMSVNVTTLQTGKLALNCNFLKRSTF